MSQRIKELADSFNDRDSRVLYLRTPVFKVPFDRNQTDGRRVPAPADADPGGERCSDRLSQQPKAEQ